MNTFEEYKIATKYWLVEYNKWPKRHFFESSREIARGLGGFIGLFVGPFIVGLACLSPTMRRKLIEDRNGR